ncbi:DUF1642 domain-containing protein [Streptococcus parasanguinis]|uniref:DUF1642 domain-containing protein n=1 Tax=Streptococcus parasanguinis TaxID=1318 RepID=UPI00352C8F01
MNKQELIKHFDDMPYVSVSQMGKKSFIDMIKQLDEPQKPVVKQFVADWYEDNKDMLEANLFECIYEIYKKRGQNIFTTFEEWLVDEHTTPFQTLVNMHQFGYEVEEEKRYLVKMKDLETGFNFLNRHKRENYWVFSSNDESITYQVYHTRKELEESGFGWVFDCPGMEVEEVLK